MQAFKLKPLTSQYSLPKNYFTAVPGFVDARALNAFFKKCLQLQLFSHLKICAKALNTNLDFLVEKISKLDVHKKWSPEIFVAADDLKRAFLSKKLVVIVDALAHLEKFLCSQIYSENLIIDTILTEAWESGYVDFLRNQEGTNAKGEMSLVLPILNDEHRQFIPFLLTALNLIESVEPQLFKEFKQYVTHIKLFQGRALMGATSTIAFGSIYLRIPDKGVDPVPYFIEHIVHELSHLTLYQLMAEDALVLNKADERFKAPIRLDLRPMYGVYHATFVLSRMILVFKHLRNNPVYGVEISEQLKKFKAMYESGVSVVTAHGNLSKLGWQVIESTAKCVS